MDKQPLEQLIDLTGVLSEQNDFEEILRLVAARAAALLEAETALIIMINPRTRRTVKTIFREGRIDGRPRYHAVHEQLAGWVIEKKRALLSVDLKTDDRFARTSWQDVDAKSAVCAVLKAEGAVIGSLMLLNRTDGAPFTNAQLAFLEKIAAVASPYLRNVQKISEYFETPLPEAALLAKYEQAGLLGKSSAFIALLKSVEAAARCDVRVLLEGETGTGKELVAQAIHRFSARKNRPFVAVDCGAIPAHLLESELFGHVKGAFTGAMRDRDGLLLAAHDGTLFMDEISNLTLDMQAKLLRALESGEIRPLGANDARKIDVRIIAASSAPLRELKENGEFRQDLYYRLHVYPIRLPPLRERREDVPLLAHHFLRKITARQEKRVSDFHEVVNDFMMRKAWRGNVRQLQNFVERLVAHAPPEATILDAGLLPEEMKNKIRKNAPTRDAVSSEKSLPENVAAFEACLIREALEANGWNQSQAARQLKIAVTTLHYKMRKLNILSK